MNEREELNALRRMAELEAKTGGASTSKNKSISRQFGLTGRYLTEGLASTAGILANPLAYVINAATGTQIPRLQNTVGESLNRAGAPSPQGGVEEFVAAPSRALAATMGFGGAGKVAELANLPRAGAVLSANPALQAKSSFAGATTGEGLRQAGAPESAQIAGSLAASMMAGRGQDTAAMRQNAVKDATAMEARKAGYTLPPVQANPTMVNRALEGWSGKISTAQGAAIKNQPLINKAALKSLGVADDVPLTPELLNEVRDKAGQSYEVIKKIGSIPVDGSFKMAIQGGARQNAKLLSKYPDMGSKEIESLSKTFNVKNMDGEDAVMLIRKLRNDASLNISARDPAKDALGRYQKKVADAIESMVGRHLEKTGQRELLNDFQKARTTIAKTYTIEKSLNESSGNVIGSKLAQDLRKGKPLSGELLQAAKVSQAFPKATQEITSSMPGISPLDMTVGAIGSASMGSPSFMSYVLGRPAVRSLILSEPYQKMMLTPSYQQGLLNINPERALGAASALGSRK